MCNESFLKRLIGKKVSEIHIGTSTVIALNNEVESRIDDRMSIMFQICFDDYRLDIYNSFKIVPEVNDLNDLKGLIVTDALELKEEAKIIFENNSELIVDMRDEAYYDPEAMCLHGPNNFWNVWN